MSSVIIPHENGAVTRIPSRVRDLRSFRRWAKSDAFPSRGRYSWLAGELWVDLSRETVGHNLLKMTLLASLGTLVERSISGHFLGGRMLLTNVDAGLSTDPDGMFLSYTSLRAGWIRLARGGDSTEVEGSPDMVFEVVSPVSAEKNTVVLRDLYWRAGVREYWVAEPRGDDVTLDILRRGRTGYVATTKREGGWMKSAVFGRLFRLTRQDDNLGLPTYVLGDRQCIARRV